MSNILDLKNKRNGKLVGVKSLGSKDNNVWWLCACDCGGEKILAAGRFKHALSCGCLNFEKKNALSHGMSRSSEYRTHAHMLSRCYNPNVPSYPDYGGRGIRVCDSWRGELGFESFFRDMGSRPSKNHSIDRVNVNGNYEPQNCRWATRSEQSKNRRKFLSINNYTNAEIIEEITRRGLMRKEELVVA